MGQALDTLCAGVEALRRATHAGAIDTVTYEASFLDEAVREIRELQREHAGSRCELEAREIEKTALREERDRARFEVQVLQMTQGALKMEIDRLRAEAAPMIAATGAEMVISTDGTVTIKANCLAVHGDVVPA